MQDDKKFPTCDAVECFAIDDGHCLLLVTNDFGYRGCPFFKTRKQVAEEKAYCEKRLANIKKGNLEE